MTIELYIVNQVVNQRDDPPTVSKLAERPGLLKPPPVIDWGSTPTRHVLLSRNTTPTRSQLADPV